VARSKGKRRRVAADIGRKGRLVERIVAWLHERPPNVRVVTREFLPTLDGRDEREVDVLVTDQNDHLNIRCAIECKNEMTAAGSANMQLFVDKLVALGIPCDKGFFVSAKGFTKPALRLATAAGVTPLVVDNLTPDRLASIVGEAVQCVVHLLPVVDSINLVSDPVTVALDTPLLYNPDGHSIAPQDLIWHAWLQGRLHPAIGQHFVQFQVPAGWYVVAGGERQTIVYLGTVVRVGGYVIDVAGPAKSHSLRHAVTGTVEKWGVEASWELPPGRHLLATFATERALVQYVSTHRPALVTRIKVPRIRWDNIYWPPSARLEEVLKRQFETAPDHEHPEPSGIADVDVDNVATAWEPISTSYSGDPVGWFTMNVEDIIYDPPEAEDNPPSQG